MITPTTILNRDGFMLTRDRRMQNNHIDKIAREITDEIYEKNKELEKDISYQEVLIICESILRIFEVKISKWTSGFLFPPIEKTP